MRAYRLTRHGDSVSPILSAGELPIPGPNDVRIEVAAASLNYRDLIVLDNAANGSYDGRIPLSDAAGRITAVGDEVQSWRVGDRVAASFFRDWLGGPFKTGYMGSALGGSASDGVLAESIVLRQTSVVANPGHLSMEQAATLPCAAVTAWQALVTREGIREGDTVLVQGTGGVALFALQFAVALGARAIVLSSSDAKLDRARQLGASMLINYRTTPEWDKAVLGSTAGEGANVVVELGGPGTYERSIRSVAAGGADSANRRADGNRANAESCTPAEHERGHRRNYRWVSRTFLCNECLHRREAVDSSCGLPFRFRGCCRCVPVPP